tara:strand:- start:177 stop:1835 length:1659 start_codon:yes stop_codon:yes gene_type:complete
MADQTIALQARAPQGNSMAAAIRQNSQLMNMMTQQAAAQRQSAVAEQQMQVAQAKEARDVSAADIKLAGDKIDFYTKRAGQTMNPQGYQLLLQDLDRDAPEVAAAFRTNMPPEQFDRGVLLQMVGSVSDNFKANYGPLETEVVQAPDGTFGVAVTGGVGKKKPGVYELEQFNLRRDGGAPAAAAPTAAAPQQGGNSMARPSRGANTSPQDLMRQGVNPNSIPSGNPLSPISTGGGAQPDLGAIVQTMMQTGVISQADMGLMTQAAGPEKAQQLAQIMRANNIQIMPNEGEAPGMSNAVFRPGVDAMPERQNVQSMDDYYATGQAARGRDLNQGAIPGSSRVPIPRVRREAEATERGKQHVRVVTEPQIAGSTKTAELQAQKDMAFPDAQAQFDAAYTTINNRLEDIKRFRAHPARDRVIGMLDAATPNFGRARGAQELYNTMVAAGTFDALQEMRTNSPTGGALGNVSDADIRLLTASIGALGQSQNEEDFYASLDVFERRLKQVQQRLETRYRENYGNRLGKNFKPPVGNASSAAAGRRTSGGFTVMKVED